MTKRKAKEPAAITVLFSPSIRADGELALVRIRQYDAEIQLTKEQAQSLVQQISARIGVPHDE